MQQICRKELGFKNESPKKIPLAAKKTNKYVCAYSLSSSSVVTVRFLSEVMSSVSVLWPAWVIEHKKDVE